MGGGSAAAGLASAALAVAASSIVGRGLFAGGGFQVRGWFATARSLLVVMLMVRPTDVRRSMLLAPLLAAAHWCVGSQPSQCGHFTASSGMPMSVPRLPRSRDEVTAWGMPRWPKTRTGVVAMEGGPESRGASGEAQVVDVVEIACSAAA